MELEFDKEIDAILRKARPARGVLVGDDPAEPKKHLDADAIAAFAENALPDQAKLLYIEHFADCDSCRKLLSRAVQMNAEADISGEIAAPSVSESTKETAISWHQSVFRTPNMALAMGALVFAFSGILGYVVFQNQNNATNATVSQVEVPEQQRGGPYFDSESEASNTAPLDALMATANPTAPASNMAANSSAAAPLSGTLGRTDADQAKPDAARENNYQLDGAGAAAEPPAKSAEAPPPVITDSISSVAGNERDEKKPVDGGKLKEESKDDQLAKKQAEDRGNRDMPRAAAKASPARSGPLQNQSNQVNNKSFEMSVIRTVGGKTFNNRNGAWYDSAYNGQATVNFRRGTDGYKKLDSGLRNIADTLGGTVVVMWKAKAYRIQ